jgi:Big-like domain-containing protein
VTPSRFVVGFVAIACAWACGGSSSSTPTTPSQASPPTVTAVAVTGGGNLTAAGQTSQLTATATFSDGSTQNVTASATWQSSNASAAPVSAGGVVTAVAAGSATVTATYQGKAGTISVTISLTTSTRSSMSAVIDGVAWNAVVVTTVKTTIPSPPGTILGLGGTNGFTGNYIMIALGIPAAVGTYTLGPTSIGTAGLQIPNARSQWVAGVLGGGGTITVSSVTATSASGTFSLTMAAERGTAATGTKTVTNGVFNVVF